MNEQIPDFIQNLNKEDASISNSSQKGFITRDNQQIPDFIAKPINHQSDIEFNSIQPDYKDIEVRQELGVNFDNSFSSNQDAVKQYVDGLSDEDYKTWTQLKNEWYSLDARKALFDNKENLYDINAKGWEKYWSNNKNSFMQFLLDQQQWTLDFQNEIIHPWSVTAQEKLNEMWQYLMKDDYNDIYNSLKAPEDANAIRKYYQNSYAKPIAWWIRQTNIAWWILTNLLSKWVNLIDNLWNLSTQLIGEWLNKVADDKKWYKEFVVDPSESVSLRASQIQAVNDALGIWFTVSYPIATYIMTTLGSESETVQKIMDWSYKWIKWVTKQVVDAVGEDTLGLEWLTEEEKEVWYENVAMATMIMFWEMLWYWWNKISNSKLMQEANWALSVAKQTSRFAKRTTENQIAQWVKSAMKDLPEGSQLTTKGWTPLFTNTANWIQPTMQGSLYLLTKIGWAKVNWFIRWLEWVYKNKDRWLVNRNPNTPVWDLPITPWVKIENETPKIENNTLKTVEETKVEPIKNEIKTEVPKVPSKVKTSTIREFVDSIKEDINNTTKKFWTSNEIYEKLKTSPELQMEYNNTIDPYIKENWANNPQWVIEEPLKDLIETIKEQLQFKKNSDTDWRINQMKTKINVPKSESWKYKADQKTYKELENLLSKNIKDPEKFLDYLLKLPEEKVNTLNQIIPNYSKNIQLIKDTLDLTKAITSTDLLWKFMTWHSNLGWMNKLSLRKYLYRKFAEAYRNKNIKTNMAKVEEILNQMSEEELINLEKEMQWWDLRKFEESEIDRWNEKWYRLDTFWEKGNWHLQEIMDSKRPWTNKTVREYLEEKWVKMTVTNAESQYRQLTHEMMWKESLAAYSENLDRMILKRFDNPYKGFIFHEFWHRLFNQLGTTQMLDMLDYISKRDWISQEAAFERRAEYFRNYMEYNNIDWKRYILKELGEAFDPKLLQVIEKTKNEVFDLFNLSDKDKGISQIMSDVKHDTEAWKEITSRKPQPLLSRRVWDDVDFRTEWLKKNIDSNIDSVMLDREIFDSPYNKGEIMIRLKDWKDIPWSKYRENLTDEQLSKIDKYQEDIFDEIINSTFGVDTEEWFVWEWKFDYKTLKNKNDLKDLLKDWYKITKEDLWLDLMETVWLMEQLKQIDPDIVWLTEKDGQLMVKYLDESYRERREQADRPWQRELKEVPAYDFFSEEEKAKFPKEVQEKIGNTWKDFDNEWNPLSLQQEKYFKNSKVRDKEWNLILVYHWTIDSGFDEFDWNRIWSSNWNEWFFWKWFYFTPDKSIAKDYMETWWSKDNSKKGMKMWYLNIKKLFDFNKAYTKAEYEKLLDKLWVTEKQLPATEWNWKYTLMNWYDFKVFNEGERDIEEFKERFGDIDLDEILQWEELTDVLKEAWYDWTLWNNWLYDEYVIFNSNQFKNINNRVPTKWSKFSDPVDLNKILWKKDLVTTKK